MDLEQAMHCFPVLGEEAVKYLKKTGEMMGRPPRVRVHNVVRTPGGIGLFTFEIDWWLENEVSKGDLCLTMEGVEVFIEGPALTLFDGEVFMLDYESRQDGDGFFFRKPFTELESRGA